MSCKAFDAERKELLLFKISRLIIEVQLLYCLITDIFN